MVLSKQLRSNIIFSKHLLYTCMSTSLSQQAAADFNSTGLVQVAEVLEASAKWPWLQSRLAQFIDDGDVLVFASTQARVDELTAQLQGAGIK